MPGIMPALSTLSPAAKAPTWWRTCPNESRLPRPPMWYPLKRAQQGSSSKVACKVPMQWTFPVFAMTRLVFSIWRLFQTAKRSCSQTSWLEIQEVPQNLLFLDVNTCFTGHHKYSSNIYPESPVLCTSSFSMTLLGHPKKALAMHCEPWRAETSSFLQFTARRVYTFSFIPCWALGQDIYIYILHHSTFTTVPQLSFTTSCKYEDHNEQSQASNLHQSSGRSHSSLHRLFTCAAYIHLGRLGRHRGCRASHPLHLRAQGWVCSWHYHNPINLKKTEKQKQQSESKILFNRSRFNTDVNRPYIDHSLRNSETGGRERTVLPLQASCRQGNRCLRSRRQSISRFEI